MDYATTLALARQFVAGLARISPGERAALRRAVDAPLSQATAAWPVFYRLLPAEIAGWPERNAFFRGATFAAQSREWRDWPAGPNLGGSLRLARVHTGNPAGLDRLVGALVQAGGPEFDDRCRRAVLLLAQQRIKINFALLITDLTFLNGRTREIWAETYFKKGA